MIISGVMMPRHSPLISRQSCKSSAGQIDCVDEEEGDDPSDWEK